MHSFPGNFFSSRGYTKHPSGRDEAGLRIRGTRNLASAAVVVGLIAATLCSTTASAFTLLRFPSQAEIEIGSFERWDRGSVQFMADINALPRVKSFKVDSDFMDSLGAQGQAEADQAARNALDTWALGTASMLSFQESDWPAVPNVGAAGPLAVWEGPSLEYFQEQPQPFPFVPGWGANIEFFSGPGTTSFNSFGTIFEFDQGAGQPDRLAFAVVNRSGSIIESAEIWLNEDYNWSTDGQGGFDIETVILHEIGHALGLDHPDQTIDGGCAGAAPINDGWAYRCHPAESARDRPGVQRGECFDSPNYDPFFWTPGESAAAGDVMNSTYSGVKRELTDDEIGGMAFLYRPFAGDVTGQFNCTLLDVSSAVQAANGQVSLDPRAFAAADFMNRNGFIDAIELTWMLDWANDPNNYDQGDTTTFDLPKAPATSMTVTATASPFDVGKGGQVDVSFQLENPDAVPILSWTINVRFDEDAFVNASCIDGDFPPAGFKIMSELEPGLIQIGKISASASGLTMGNLGDLLFDINLADAVPLESGDFAIEFIEVVVNDGMIRVYGSLPSDSVFLNDAGFIASDLDVNADAVVDQNDLYQWHLTPIDVNQNNLITDSDRERLSDCLRGDELIDLLTEQD